MKLLFCSDCGSVFSLAIRKDKSCDCGKVTGKYINYRMAVTNGKGTAIGIGNGSLDVAINRLRVAGNKHEREHYLENTSVICWVRPNSGPGNPHTEEVEYCPQCNQYEGLKWPRNEEVYCEDCGWPHENRPVEEDE